MSSETVLVRATVKMQGVVAGQTVKVDPDDEHIAKLIRARLLVVESSDKLVDKSVTDEG